MNNWHEKQLGEVLTLQRGFDLPVTDRRPGLYPVVASTGIVGTHTQAKVKGPGVVIGRSGSLGGGQYIKYDFWPLNTTLWVKDFKGNDRLFCYYLLKSLDLARFNAGSGVPTLNRNHIHPLLVYVPTDVDEQRAIAHILGSLDDKIELNRRMNATLEATARAIFKSWFVDFDPVHAKMRGEQPSGMDAETAALFPDAFEDSELGPIPAGWRVESLGSCCKRVENGGTPKRDKDEYWLPGSIPWLTSGEVRQRIVVDTGQLISEEGYKHSSAKLWPIGTSVVAMYGATAGQVCLLGHSMCANQACCGLVPEPDMQSYIYIFLTQLENVLAQQARGSAQQNLSQRIIAEQRVVSTTAPIFASFEAIVWPLLKTCINNSRESIVLAQLRDVLLPKLISGELRIADLPIMEDADGKVAQAL